MNLNGSNVFRLIFAWLVALTPKLVLGETLHSLAIEWQRYEETLSGANRTMEIRPEILNIHYTYQFQDEWALAVSAWKGGDDKHWGNRWRLEQDLDGLSAMLSYQQAFWWLDFGTYLGHSDINLNIPATDKHYSEQVDVLDTFVNFNYDIEWQHWWVTPTVGLGYQKAESEAMQTFLYRNDLRLRETYLQYSEGIYLTTNLNLAYPLPVSDVNLFLPSFSLGWTESIWGEAYSRARMETLNTPIVRSQPASQNESAESDGSRFMALAVSLLMEMYFIDLSLTKPLADDALGKQVSLQLGLNF